MTFLPGLIVLQFLFGNEITGTYLQSSSNSLDNLLCQVVQDLACVGVVEDSNWEGSGRCCRYLGQEHCSLEKYWACCCKNLCPKGWDGNWQGSLNQGGLAGQHSQQRLSWHHCCFQFLLPVMKRLNRGSARDFSLLYGPE